MLKNKHVGVWGFGKTGKSMVNYLLTQNCIIGIMDKRTPTQEEQTFIHTNNIAWYNETDQNLFFNSYEHIIPSSGVNISPTCYATHKQKWLSELDAFQQLFHKPIIAITGSIGKTSTTHIFGHLFKELSMSVFVGGNIGIPTFDIIPHQHTVDYALLEVSSFQLMHCTSFAPKLSLWTNFHPNHLDYHETEQNYFLAKQKVLDHQKNGSSIIPYALRHKVPTPSSDHTRGYFTITKPDTITLNNNEMLYYVENDVVIRYTTTAITPLMTLTPALKNLSFIDNILAIAAACDLLNLDHHPLHVVANTVQLPKHRIENIGSYKSVDFYNDSKATTTASTMAAVEKLSNRPLHLFIGGLSKGVDRAPFIAELKNKVKHIYCFGKEATTLHELCIKNNISATMYTTLSDAVSHCFTQLKQEDRVLLSPAGSSYDLYADYEERGNHFKKLIAHHIQKLQLS